MDRRSWKTGAAALLSAGLLAFGLACEVEQTREGSAPDVDVAAEGGNLPEYEIEQEEEGSLPDVDVDVEGGQAPQYDVDTPDVDVERETVEVPVPEIDIEDEEDEAMR